jgi:hypothetical protein
MEIGQGPNWGCNAKGIYIYIYIYIVSFVGGRVRLSPLGTSATNWSTLPAPDDR